MKKEKILLVISFVLSLIIFASFLFVPKIGVDAKTFVKAKKIPTICNDQDKNYGKTKNPALATPQLFYEYVIANTANDNLEVIDDVINVIPNQQASITIKLATLDWSNMPKYSFTFGKVNRVYDLNSPVGSNQPTINYVLGNNQYSYDDADLSNKTSDVDKFIDKDGKITLNDAYLFKDLLISFTWSNEGLINIPITIQDTANTQTSILNIDLLISCKTDQETDISTSFLSYSAGTLYSGGGLSTNEQDIYLYYETTKTFNLQFSLGTSKLINGLNQNITLKSDFSINDEKAMDLNFTSEILTLMPKKSGKFTLYLVVSATFRREANDNATFTKVIDQKEFTIYAFNNNDFFFSVQPTFSDSFSKSYNLTNNKEAVIANKNEGDIKLRFSIHATDENLGFNPSCLLGYKLTITQPDFSFYNVVHEYRKKDLDVDSKIDLINPLEFIYDVDMSNGVYNYQLEIFDDFTYLLLKTRSGYIGEPSDIVSLKLSGKFTITNQVEEEIKLSCGSTYDVYYDSNSFSSYNDGEGQGSNEPKFVEAKIQVLNYDFLGSLDVECSMSGLEYYFDTETKEVILYFYSLPTRDCFITFISEPYKRLVKINFIETSNLEEKICFEQGEHIAFYLSGGSKTKTLSLERVSKFISNNFTFFIAGQNVIHLNQISATSVEVTATSAGKCSVVAYLKSNNGLICSASIEVNVFDEEPTLSIDIAKQNTKDLTAFTVYDVLKVSLNTQDFGLSKEATYTWYVNDKIMTKIYDVNGNALPFNNQSSFYYRLPEGTNTFKVVVVDESKSLSKTITQNIIINKSANVERVLSLSFNEVAYALIDGGNFTIEAFVDGISDNKLKYTWAVDNLEVINIENNNNNNAVFKILKLGEANITTTVNIGSYGNDKILTTNLKLIVEEFKTISIKANVDHIYPNNDAEINILINDHQNTVNANCEILISKDGTNLEEEKYTRNNNTIYFKNMEKGKYNFSANYNNNKAAKSYRVSPFNYNLLLKALLPFLFGMVLVIMIAFFATRKVRNPLFIVTKRIENIIKEVDLVNNQLMETNESQIGSIKKLYKSFGKLSADVTYFYDEGMDDFKSLNDSMKGLKHLLFATYKSNAKVKIQKKVLKEVSQKYVPKIESSLEEIKHSRELFEKDFKNKNSLKVNDISQKKNKKEAENYAEYVRTRIYNYTADSNPDENSEELDDDESDDA